MKWVTYAFVPAGVILGGAGLYGDAHGWWDERGFLTNLLSSVTSLLFGVPTALIILGQLGAHQAEALERRAVRRRARLAIDRFRQALLRLFSHDDLERLHETLRQLFGATYQWSEALKSLGEDEASRRALLDAIANRHPLIEACLKLRRPLDIGEWRDELLLRWRQLDDEIRPRVEDAGLHWVPPTTHMTVRRAFGDIDQEWEGVGPFTGVDRYLRVLLGEEERRGVGGPEHCRQRLERQGENDQLMILALLALLGELPEIEKIAT
ncbi:hypothetical protein ACFY3G_17930 [Streptomyces phaeochromogenes]|uniref:hypothetical protein n=1 Tax=Streptomyces phaeochromogenes TaxID=1923 RepID=UPI0036923CEE